MLTVRHRQPAEDVSSVATETRPIMLVTFAVRFDPRAAEFAIDTAVEAGQPLIIVNVVELELMPASMMFGYDLMTQRPELMEALRAPAVLACSLGVRVERLRVVQSATVTASWPHSVVVTVVERTPVATAQTAAGSWWQIVFGPDRAELKPRIYRRALRKIRDRSTCLIWVAD